MKKHIIAAVFCCLIVQTMCQTITLTFLGQNASTQNGLPLESVYIQNTTLGCDTMIYGETPSLVLTNSLGIDDSKYYGSEQFILLPPMPNPYNGSTTVKIISNKNGELKFKLIDTRGIVITEYRNNFIRGHHNFEIKSSGNKLLLLMVTDGNSVKSTKLICNGNGTGESKIIYVGMADKKLKNSMAGSGFSFQFGNQLLYKSIKAGYFDEIMTDSPTQNSTYTFQLTQSAGIPSVVTSIIINVACTTATGGGEVTLDGGASVLARGVCWSTSQNPTTANSHTTNGTGTGTFISNLINLTANTTYYVRAYATNSAGTAFGDQQTFSSSPTTLPALSTTTVTNYTQTAATSGGNVTSDGCANVTTRGVCWSTSPNPTLSDSHTTNGTGTGSFTSNLTNLTANTTYYVRAYSTNSVGTAYGDQQTFTTLPIVLPTVTTTGITNVTNTTAASGGNVTSDGGASVSARGVCWSTSPNPTIAGSHTTNGTGTGTFTSNLTNLTANTTYYVRAYATNNVGTAYGDQKSFNTLPNPVLPSITTNSVTNIQATTATSGGNVTSDGGASVTARGVCWNTSPNPTISNSHTTNGSGTGSFISDLTNLTGETTYYVKAYATNNVGTAYGNQQTFTTSFQCGVLVQYEGKNYNTVQIGTQCWFKKNLNVGTRIDASDDQTNNGIKEKYCYNNTESNCDVYGGLYKWDEMMQYTTSQGTKGLCPSGWHIPTDDEWGTLKSYLNTNIGGKLKETGTTHWASPNTGATNSSGFTGLPGGETFYPGGLYQNLTYWGTFWTSTENGDSWADTYSITYNNGSSYSGWSGKGYAFSVRCIKD